MASMTMLAAIRDTIIDEMERDDRVVVLGEDVGAFVVERMAMVLIVLGTRPERQFIGRPTQVANDQLMLGEPAVQEGLEVAEKLQAFGQRVP